LEKFTLLNLVTGLVWEGGVSRPAEVRNQIARLPVSRALEHVLARGRGREAGGEEKART